MKSKLYTFAAFAALAFALGQAHAAGNPLHPTFYWGAAGEQAATGFSGASYANANDPLHPTYQRSGDGKQWQSLNLDVKGLYVDRGNPRYPNYQR